MHVHACMCVLVCVCVHACVCACKRCLKWAYNVGQRYFFCLTSSRQSQKNSTNSKNFEDGFKVRLTVIRLTFFKSTKSRFLLLFKSKWKHIKRERAPLKTYFLFYLAHCEQTFVQYIVALVARLFAVKIWNLKTTGSTKQKQISHFCVERVRSWILTSCQPHRVISEQCVHRIHQRSLQRKITNAAHITWILQNNFRQTHILNKLSLPQQKMPTPWMDKLNNKYPCCIYNAEVLRKKQITTTKTKD